MLPHVNRSHQVENICCTLGKQQVALMQQGAYDAHACLAYFGQQQLRSKNSMKYLAVVLDIPLPPHPN
jgi:hypothetical protein